MANWNKRFMDLARHISTWSKDTNTKLGAVIVDKENTILSVGYNGFCRNANDNIKERYERPKKYLYTEHAERNAIYNAVRSGISLKDGMIYVPLFPCVDCARGIINSGIKKLVTYEPDFGHDRWGESFRVSYEILKECGVTIEYFSDEYDEFYKNFSSMEGIHRVGIIEWDYAITEKVFFEAQSDWNQTLFTKINQAGTTVYQMSLSGGANKIRVSPRVFDIISTLEFFHMNTMMLGSRYHVVIDNNMPMDEIVVYNDGIRGYYVLTDENIKNGWKAKSIEDHYMLIKIKNYE